MTKGTFGTPRTRETIDEIRPVSARVRFHDIGVPDGDFTLSATLDEGNEVGGVFEIKESGAINTQERLLSAADKVIVEDFLSMVIRLYADDKGYTGVVIT